MNKTTEQSESLSREQIVSEPTLAKTEKRFLQKMASVVSMLCTITAIGLGIYLTTIYQNGDKIIVSAIGASTFFFFIVGLVLNVIANSNLPDLTVARKKAGKK